MDVTAVLAPGTLIIGPGDAGLLAVLCREGVVAVGTRRSLPARTAALLRAVEDAAAAARSVAGTVGGAGKPGTSSSTVTVTQAAKELDMSVSYVRRLCRTGALVAERCGPLWMVDADSVASHGLSRRENVDGDR